MFVCYICIYKCIIKPLSLDWLLAVVVLYNIEYSDKKMLSLIQIWDWQRGKTSEKRCQNGFKS